MIKQVKFKNGIETHFLGRNGYFRCTGFTLMDEWDRGVVSVWPITSKENDGRCKIEIPFGRIDEFIDALREIRPVWRVDK